MPDLSHIKTSDYGLVYEPSEDSFLVMETFEHDRQFLSHILPSSPNILEVGVGSGILSAYASILLRHSHPLLPSLFPADTAIDSSQDVANFKVKSFGVDINPDAVRIANETYQRNGLDGKVVLSDLATAVHPELDGKVDVLIFNPPYVPSEREEITHGDMLAKSYAGGDRGREVLDRFIPDIPTLLSPNGAFYVVVLHPANELDELSSRLSKMGFIGHTVVARREGIEMLAIVRYMRADALRRVKEQLGEEIYRKATKLDATTAVLKALRRF